MSKKLFGKKYIYTLKMKHKRHQKDRRDKSERYRLDDHRYFKSESNATSVKREHKVQQHYIMRDLSNNSGDENEPKKLIIYIVNMFFFSSSGFSTRVYSVRLPFLPILLLNSINFIVLLDMNKASLLTLFSTISHFRHAPM